MEVTNKTKSDIWCSIDSQGRLVFWLPAGDAYEVELRGFENGRPVVEILDLKAND